MEPELLFIYMIHLRIIYKFQTASFLPTSIVYNARSDLHADTLTIFTSTIYLGLSLSSFSVSWFRSKFTQASRNLLKAKLHFHPVTIIVTFAYIRIVNESSFLSREAVTFPDAENRLRRKRKTWLLFNPWVRMDPTCTAILLGQIHA